jgi:hypothetical protein
MGLFVVRKDTKLLIFSEMKIEVGSQEFLFFIIHTINIFLLTGDIDKNKIEMVEISRFVLGGLRGNEKIKK